jgi:integrase
VKLTDKIVERLELPAGKDEHIEWDADLPSHGVRLRRNAKHVTKRYVAQYRLKTGGQGREVLGDPRKLSVADSRKAARALFGKVAIGLDPAADKAKARAEAAAVKLTLATVSVRYLDARTVALRPASLRAARWHLLALWLPLHKKPIAAITRRDVADRLDEIVKQSGRVAAARARGSLSALYAWSIAEGLCEVNPVAGTNDPAKGIEARERTLSDGELSTIWHACREDDFGRIVRLLILLGARRSEIGSMQWTEIDLDSGTLIIPGDRTKNHKPLALTLPPLALDILRSVPRRPGFEHVFGTAARGYTAWSYSLACLNVRIAEAQGKPLAAWSLHDVRRSMRSGLGRLGIAPHIGEKCIGHLVGNEVQRTYDRYSYTTEVGAALAKWSDHVAAIVANDAISKVA